MFFRPKLIVLLAVAAVFLIEWRKGSFRRLAAEIRSIQFWFYIRVLLIFSVVSAAIFFVDSAILRVVQNVNHAFFDFISRAGGILGKGINPWIFIIVWYAIGLILKRASLTMLAFGAILSSALSAVLCHISKIFFLRARPNSNLGPFSFFNFEGFSNGGGTYESFPSGDVVVVAGMAYFLFCSIKNRLLRFLLFLLPLSTALSRIDVNRHWPSDTVPSLGLALVSALVVRNLLALGKK